MEFGVGGGLGGKPRGERVGHPISRQRIDPQRGQRLLHPAGFVIIAAIPVRIGLEPFQQAGRSRSDVGGRGEVTTGTIPSMKSGNVTPH